MRDVLCRGSIAGRVRLATLTQPDPGSGSVAALVPREGNIRNHRHDESLLSLALLSEGSLTCEAQLIPAQEGQVQIPESQTPIPTFADVAI